MNNIFQIKRPFSFIVFSLCFAGLISIFTAFVLFQIKKEIQEPSYVICGNVFMEPKPIDTLRNSNAHEIGRNLFQSQCTACHKVDKDMIGPALVGIKTKRAKTWIIEWIRNNQTFSERNKLALEAQEFSPTSCPSYQYLSEQEILAIIHYIDPLNSFIEEKP